MNASCTGGEKAVIFFQKVFGKQVKMVIVNIETTKEI